MAMFIKFLSSTNDQVAINAIKGLTNGARERMCTQINYFRHFIHIKITRNHRRRIKASRSRWTSSSIKARENKSRKNISFKIRRKFHSQWYVNKALYAILALLYNIVAAMSL